MKTYLLLGRDGCHLCESFEEALRTHPATAAWRIEHACVDERAEWRMRFGRRIPVLLDERGEVVAEGHFDPDRIGAASG
ncbi:glutaredoxin family protein [Fontimonas sp. SYSU GA230001]|uniref:glutaredoxin family protein n=1 Tax=Fontimonas sp. SYSU GA230001 TaxID=3142450 RepID=UPI0032B4E8F7